MCNHCNQICLVFDVLVIRPLFGFQEDIVPVRFFLCRFQSSNYSYTMTSTRQKIKNIGETIRRAPSTASRKFSRQGRVLQEDEGRMRNRSGSQLEVNKFRLVIIHFIINACVTRLW